MTDETMELTHLDPETLGNVHLVASTLAPFFLHDPILDENALHPLLDALSEIDAHELAETWPFGKPDDIYPYSRMIIDGLVAANADEYDASTARDSLDLDGLASDYRQLFVGPAKKAAPQWGSVYTDKDGVTFGTSTLQLQDWLAQNGIAISFGESDEPEDSLGALLALLAWLTDEKPETILDLLQLHILPWSSHFLDLMEENAAHPFYRGLAGITRLSLEGMQEAFELNVETPRFYR